MGSVEIVTDNNVWELLDAAMLLAQALVKLRVRWALLEAQATHSKHKKHGASQ